MTINGETFSAYPFAIVTSLCSNLRWSRHVKSQLLPLILSYICSTSASVGYVSTCIQIFLHGSIHRLWFFFTNDLYIRYSSKYEIRIVPEVRLCHWYPRMNLSDWMSVWTVPAEEIFCMTKSCQQKKSSLWRHHILGFICNIEVLHPNIYLLVHLFISTLHLHIHSRKNICNL